MAAGGWNKGIKNSTGSAFKGKKHSAETIEKLKNRPKESYKKPKAEKVNTQEMCHYGCGQTAQFRFANKKFCCSQSFNSCPAKRKAFSENVDHKTIAAKSLKTRSELGITKSSRKKAVKTMHEQGTYDILRKKMQELWAENPWNNNLKCPLVKFKDTDIIYQGTYEYNFLEKLELDKGIIWLQENVQRGPSLWYQDPIDKIDRLYISDFLIDNTIYEIKSSWTWNKNGRDEELEMKNKKKLTSCIDQGYNVILVLNGEEIDAATLD
jgi:hypothetical protein